MSKLEIIVTTILLLAGLTFIIWGIYEQVNFEPHETKCYDRYYNEILDQKCLDENGDGVPKIMVGSLLIFLAIFLWFALSLINQDSIL